MEYKSEFETRDDVFRVNVFHNKKNGEKVTMYFVPRSTPVNEDTVFDYCTKNKTWREKQAQQWCDEKIGKNKDKLKSLPFVAGGLQRDLKWFGDKATALFDDYKKGLGMTVQPRNNNQTGGNQGFQDKLKSLASLGEKEIVQKFNELFKAGGDNWRTSDAGHNAYGEALMNAELTIKGKGGQSKTYKTKAGSGIEPAVGKRAAQRNVILAFLAEEYGIDVKAKIVEEKIEDLQEGGHYEDLKYLKVLEGRENVRFLPSDYGIGNYYIKTPFGNMAFFENDDVLDGVDSRLYLRAEGGVTPDVLKEIKLTKEEEAEIQGSINERIEKVTQNTKDYLIGHKRELNYLQILDKRDDVYFHSSLGEYYVDIDGGRHFSPGFEYGYLRSYLPALRKQNPETLEVLEAIKISDEEKNEISQDIDNRVKKVIEGVEQEKAAEKTFEDFNANVKENNISAVEEYFANGGEVSNEFDDETLRLADSPEMIKLLIKNGAWIENDNGGHYDDDSEEHSFLVDAIDDIRPDQVAVYLQCGANPKFDGTYAYYSEDHSVDLALERNDRFAEKNPDLLKSVAIIKQMIEDARNGKPREEIIYEDYLKALENAQQKQAEQSAKETVAETKDVISATKTSSEIEENVAQGAALASVAKKEYIGTPLSIVSDDKGMVHLAPRENLKQSAIFSMSLFGNKGEEIPIKVALVSDGVPLQSNTKLSQEDMITHADAIDNSVFLVSYSKAKEIVGEMERHGKTADASQARIRINLFKNMGEKSPIEKPYDGNIFTQFIARGGKGLGE